MIKSTQKSLTIGELAHRAQVHVETVRYYQKRGLLPKIPKPEQGYTRYPADLVARIAFIKSAQHMDFSLNEIKELFDLSTHQLDKQSIRKIARERLAQVQHMQIHLNVVENTLKQWLYACEHSPDDGTCPIIERIKQEGAV